MEELKPEELEELVQELQEESEEEETLSPEVEQLLRDLQPARRFTARLRAARQLGGLGSSSRQIVHALATVAEIDDSEEVRAVAAESLCARVHQEYLREDPDLMEVVEKALEQRPGSERQGPHPGTSSEPAELEAQLESIAKSDSGLAGLFAAVAASALKSGRASPSWAGQRTAGSRLSGKGPDHHDSDESQSLSYHTGAALGALFVRVRRSLTKRLTSVDPGEPEALKSDAIRKPSRGHGGDLAQDCPTCGAWNEPGHEICDECGSTLEGAAA
jgi:hypothetical protein